MIEGEMQPVEVSDEELKALVRLHQESQVKGGAAPVRRRARAKGAAYFFKLRT